MSQESCIYIFSTILCLILLSKHKWFSINAAESTGITTQNYHSILLTKVSKRLMMPPNINAITDPDELLLDDEHTVVYLTGRSTRYNKRKINKTLFKYNMTSPRYRRKIIPHKIVINSTMSIKEYKDLQYLRWREVFCMDAPQLKYYLDLRRKKCFLKPRRCPSCREDVLDTYELANLHSISYDDRGYVKVDTPGTVRYPYCCHICPEEFENAEQMNEHYVNHSIQFGKYPTFQYPYTEAPTKFLRPTTIYYFNGEPQYWWAGK